MKGLTVWQCCYDKVIGHSWASFLKHHKSKRHLLAVKNNPHPHAETREANSS